MVFFRSLIIILLFYVSVGFSQDFLPHFGGVPLYSDVAIDEDGVSSFEVADGRIAQVRGRVLSSYSSVVDFYRGVLPSLGWVELDYGGGLYFVRDEEALWIDFGVGGVDEVLFRLGPQV